ncbi:dual specificity testis-specific protein kinase 1-like [Penaeus vannamei]|uniref:dual specificity testis-specific protein kinase 1-like n=1 Tax=Penaeus vannamei TaxID=6689 RepID=UPI00387FAA45
MIYFIIILAVLFLIPVLCYISKAENKAIRKEKTKTFYWSSYPIIKAKKPVNEEEKGDTFITSLSLLDPFLTQISSEHEVEKAYAGAYAVVDIVQKSDDQKVAVKRNRSMRRRREITLHEAAILATLNGKAGAPKLICTDPDKGIIVMEYLGPNTLYKVIRSRRQRDITWLKILYSCADKLQELHQAGFVHADLNIKNVMITYKQGNPMAHIIDFGLARKIGQTGQFGPVPNWEKKIQRKPWYAAEMYRGEVLDELTDVVALAQIVRHVLDQMQRPPSSLRSLANLGMEINRENRPPVAEFLTVLEDILIGE